MAISIPNEGNSVRLGPLVKGGWIFLTDRSEKDWGIPSNESPRHFVALSPLTRGVKAGRGMRLPRRILKCPLAVPEKIFGLTLILDFFDRGAKPCSLYPPLAALAGFAL